MQNISIKNLAGVAGGYEAINSAIGAAVGGCLYVADRISTGENIYIADFAVIASIGAMAGYFEGPFGDR